MLKDKWKLIFILISLILIVVVSNYFTRDKYTVTNEDTIKKVASKEKFELLNYKIVNIVDKPFSLIAYKDYRRIGVGMLTIVNGQEEFVRELEIQEDKKQVVQTIGRKSGSPYLALFINSEEILMFGKTISITFPNQRTQTKKMNVKETAYIFISDSSDTRFKPTEVDIRDGQGKVIYKK
ncbi:hypothetical protein ASL14_12880 [Paenibacillus sp. IHB B 3084]|uniref:hypothetical protein n=1 Tax=Paenibacillus sp. IHB B 3084 TaxID=867076 RepID=UPI0007210B18|nr:hypothetical protein [Paenibacillus sp. IHB B 3084]ALP36929.1 hypothetical protein ASL14_12880 [Paenibacillus sp. IHB B 3084]